MNRPKPIQTKRLFLLTVLTAFILLNISYANAENAYWTTGRGIQRGALENGAPQTIIPVTLGVPNGIAIDSGNGQMYWGDTGTRKIQRSNLDGSSIEDLVEVRTSGVAIDLAGGKMYWTNDLDDTIQRANLDGSNVETLVTDLTSPQGIALDTAGGKMYWTDDFDGTIQRANLDGSQVEILATGLENPTGIALDIAAGKIYWTDDIDNTIQRANLDGSLIQTLVTDLTSPQGIALDPAAGKMYWTTFDTIQRADLDGSNIEDLVTNLVFPQGIAVPGGGKMYWTAPAKIQRADLDGSNIEDLITSVLSSPQGIAVDPGDGSLAANGKIYWVDNRLNKIQRADLDGSNIEDLVTGLSFPTGIALDSAAGKMYWTTISAIQRANLDGSNIETLVTNILLPQGIAVDPGGGKMYWVNLGLIFILSSVQRANLDGSDTEVLVTLGVLAPTDIAVNAARNKIYWTQFSKIRQANLNGIFPRDVVTGVAPTGIDIDPGGGKIYWTSTDKIQRVNFDGSNVEDVFTDIFFPRYIALDVPPGGCPLTQLVPESKPNALTDLRQFRDNVLATNPTGKELTRLYYRHSSEITSILWRHPLLGIRGTGLLLRLLPGIRYITGKPGGRDITMNALLVARIRWFLTDLQKHSSDELSETLSWLSDQLQASRGMRMSRMWATTKSASMVQNVLR
jgi:DNA-binding beta-propeller fold protein YncE